MLVNALVVSAKSARHSASRTLKQGARSLCVNERALVKLVYILIAFIEDEKFRDFEKLVLVLRRKL
jgi:hypothetical protein